MNFEHKRNKLLRELAELIEHAPSPSAVDELWHDVETLFNGPLASGPYTPPGEGGGNGEPPDPP